MHHRADPLVRAKPPNPVAEYQPLTRRQLEIGQALVNGLHDSELAALALDRAGQIYACSSGAQRLFGTDLRDSRLAYSDCPELFRAFRRCLGGQRVEVDLFRLPWRADLGRWHGECAPLTAEGVQYGVLILLRDDHERHTLRAQLKEAHRFESLGRAAGEVVHDVNNLLTGIRGSLALVKQAAANETRCASALDAADLAAQRAGELAKQLLLQGSGVDESPATNPEVLLRQTVALMERMPGAIPVVLDLRGKLGEVAMPPTALERVVLNLLLNARDAVLALQTPPGAAQNGQVTLVAERVLKRSMGRGEAQRWLRIRIQDTGQGMDDATLSRIFEPFFSTKSQSQGTGLGLCSVRNLVQDAGGWLEVTSAVSKGSSFDVYLPPRKHAGNVMNDPGRRTSAAAGRRVLVCDDETRLATLTAGLLEEFGYESATVSLADEALAVLCTRNLPIDVLLLDVNLSAGLSASELLAALTAKGNAVPVILTSGLASEDLPPELRTHKQVKGYLAKPYTVEELIHAISSAMTLHS